MSISIWIENSSNKRDSIHVNTFINDSLCDSRTVYKDSIADRIHPFRVNLNLPKYKNNWAFKFKLSNSNEEAVCLVAEDSLANISFLHVNFVERYFKKGTAINSHILDEDSLFEKSFYCELMPRQSK